MISPANVFLIQMEIVTLFVILYVYTLDANFSICCSTKVVVLNSLGRIVSFSTGSVTVLSCAVISLTTSLAVSVKGSLVALDTFSVFTRDSA